MKTTLTKGQLAWKVIRVMFKITFTLIGAVLAIASDSKKPVCGSAEAYRRKEDGTITPDEFSKAINHH